MILAKTNPLQLLFDRYETILLCWQIGNATKDNCQIALASLEKAESFTSEYHFIPLFTVAENVQLWHFFPPQILSTPYSLIWECKQAVIIWQIVWEYEIIQTLTFLGINIASLSGCKLPSSCSFSKETPTMKIYRRKTGQVHWCWRITQNLNHFSYLSDHTTYMQTSTLMKLLCVYVCILVT